MTRELSGDFPRSLNNIHHLLELSSDFENDQLFCVDTLSTHEQFFLNYDTLCSLDTYGKALDDLFRGVPSMIFATKLCSALAASPS